MVREWERVSDGRWEAKKVLYSLRRIQYFKVGLARWRWQVIKVVYSLRRTYVFKLGLAFWRWEA
jgi:hypothetical protein